MQLKAIGNLSIAKDMIKINPNDFNAVTEAVKNLGKEYAVTAIATSSLSEAQKIKILINKGLTAEEAKAALATATLSASQKAATGTTIGLGAAIRGLGDSIKAFLASNPLGWIAIAASILYGVYRVWEHFDITVEEATESMKESQEEFNSLQSNISSLEAELDTCTSRLKELQTLSNNGTITLVEKEEYENLVKTNDEIERQLRINKEKAQLAAMDAVKSANDAVDDTFTTKYRVERIDAAWAASVKGNAWIAVQEQQSNINLEIERAIEEYKRLGSEMDALSTKLNSNEISDTEYKELSGQLEAKQENARRHASILNDTLTTSKKAYEDLIFTGGELNDSEEIRYNSVVKSTDIYYEFIKMVDGTTEALTELQENTEQPTEFEKKSETSDLDISSNLSEIESAYSTITNAMQEYNEQGYLNMNTVDSLIALDDAYVNQLIDENGNLQYNAEAFNELAKIKLEEAKAEIYRQALSRISTLVSQEQEKATLKEAQAHDILSESIRKEAQNRLIELENTEFIDLGEDIMDAADKKAALLDNQIANLTFGTKKLDKAVGNTKDTVQDFTQALDAELNLLDTKMDQGLLNFSDYISQRKALIQKYYDENKIDAEKYYNYLKQHYENQLSDMDRVTSAVNRRFDKEIDSINKVIEGIESQNKSLEEQIEIMESAVDAVVDYYNELIQNQEKSINETNKRNDVLAQEVEGYDSLLNVIQRVYTKEQDRLLEQQDILQQRIDALNDESSAYDLLYRKEQALYALRQAQSQRTKKVYTAGKGYTYDTDELAIRDAEKNLADIKTEEIVSQLEQEKNALQESIDSLDEWKNKWAEVSDTYQNTVEERIAADLLGEDYESRILSNKLEDIESFKNKYFAANEEIDDNSQFIEAYNEKIKYYEDLKNQWSNLTSDLAKEKDKQNATEIFGPDWEKNILEGNFTDYNNFKDSYKNIQNQINDNTALIESYNEKIKYYQNLKDQWSSITTAYEESVDDQYAAQILGQNWEADILSGRLDSLNNFKNKYLAIQQTIANAARESAALQKGSDTLDLTTRSLSENYIITAQDGERILTQGQNNLWEQWTESTPNLQNLNNLLPQINDTTNLATREQTVNVTQQVSINCPNVTDKSGAEYISRALNKTYLDSIQYKHRQ